MQYTIVPVTADHLDQMEEIERLCFSDPWSRRLLSELLENEAAATLAAVGEDGAVLGYAGIQVVLDEGYIANIAVDPKWRRQGLAGELLEVYCRFAQAHLAFLTLEVRASNEAAIALYVKHGFVQAGVRKNYYQDPKEDALIMTREFHREGEA